MDVSLFTAIDPLSYQVTPDLGLMYVASAVRRSGFEVEIRDCRRLGWTHADLAAHVKETLPRVAGIKVYSNEVSRAGRMAETIKKASPETIVIVGGPHPSMDPLNTLKDMPSVDYAFSGESEASLPAFLEWLGSGKGTGPPPEAIGGVSFRLGEEVEVRPPDFSLDLADLPFPAWDLMPPRQYADEAAGVFVPAFPAAPVMLSRGCPYRCSYCGGRYVVGGRLRYRPVESVLEEIDFLAREHGVKTFTFTDDSFTGNRERAVRLFEALARRDPPIYFTFPNGIRVDTIDAELVRLMERAGCRLLALGIESGNNRTLERMKKRQTVELIREKVELIRRESSIMVTGFFILGYPGETIEEVKRTIAFAASLPIHHAHFCIFIPIPGTPIHGELVERGMLRPGGLDPERLTVDQAMDLPGLPAKKMLRLHQYSYLRFYLTPWRALSLLGQFKSGEHVKGIARRVLKLLG